MPKKILALVSEPISGDVLRSALGGDVPDDAEVLVLAPALNSKWNFLLADPDPAIERAQEVQAETAERLDEEGIDAAAAPTPGEEDPLLALQDALATYPADEILLFTHAGDSRNWAEEGLVDEAKERFEAPVRHIEVS